MVCGMPRRPRPAPSIGKARCWSSRRAVSRSTTRLVRRSVRSWRMPLPSSWNGPNATRSTGPPAPYASCPRRPTPPVSAILFTHAIWPMWRWPSPTSFPPATIRPDTVHTLRGLAWKERANALRFLAEYPAALDALDHAERELSGLGRSAFELGSIAYIRASVLMYMDRLGEATRQAAESATLFASHGDTQGWMRARGVEAGVLFYRREFAEAAIAFDQLRAYAESKEDAIGMARHSYNMATCFLELGDATRAAPLLLDARRTFQQQDVRTWLVRTDWMLGIMARVTGRFEESIAQFRAVRKASEQLALPEEAAA